MPWSITCTEKEKYNTERSLGWFAFLTSFIPVSDFIVWAKMHRLYWKENATGQPFQSLKMSPMKNPLAIDHGIGWIWASIAVSTGSQK